ncbi:MAG: phosphopantetheine-binding protein [Ferrimicrobium acidiphilum]
MTLADKVALGVAILVLVELFILVRLRSPSLDAPFPKRAYRAQIRARNERLDALAEVLPEDFYSGKEQEVFAQVVDGIVKFFEVERHQVRGAMSFDDLGADPLGGLVLVLHLEDALAIPASEMELGGISTVGELTTTLAQLSEESKKGSCKNTPT